MDDINEPFETIHRVERQESIQVILDDVRRPEDRKPVSIRIIVTKRGETPAEPPESSEVRVIHAKELERMMEEMNRYDTTEEKSMTLGEALTLLIAMGVLIYLIVALLWPGRF